MLLRKLRSLFQRRRLEREMAEEMRLHLDRRVQEKIVGGMAPYEARRSAEREFGHADGFQEVCRDQRGWGWVEDTASDVRYAARGLARAPGFTATAVLTLALGIGLVTIQLSLLNGALFTGLPFPSGSRIVALTPFDAKGNEGTPAYADLVSWRVEQRSFAGIAGYFRQSLELSAPGLAPTAFRGAAFTAGLLELLHVKPVLGRAFAPHDEIPGAPPVLLISDEVWRNEFGADPGIVGRSVRVREESATVIGVLPADFAFPQNERVWINLRPSNGSAQPRVGTDDRCEVVAGLADGFTLDQARAEFAVLAARSPGLSAGTVLRIREYASAGVGGKVGLALFSLMGVASGVLGIACLNVANLLSARALQRSHELALRGALGASRGRLVRQLLVESGLLTILGAAGGVALAAAGVPLVNRGLFLDASKPFWVAVELDERVLGLTALLTVGVGLVAGLIPALRATRGAAGDVLKDAAAGSTGAKIGRLNRALVVLQVGVACGILLAICTLVEAVLRHARVKLPFAAEATLVGDLRLPPSRFPDPAARSAFQVELLERMRSLPGVTQATLSRGYPLARPFHTVIESGETPGQNLRALSIYHYGAVAPGFFRDAGIGLREGRDFTADDRAGSERVAIVNVRLAQALWPGESALGKAIRLQAGPNTAGRPWLVVVGIAETLEDESAAAHGGRVLQVPMLQESLPEVVMLVMAGRAALPGLPNAIREAVGALSPDATVANLRTVAGELEQRNATARILAELAFVFGASGLLLAGVGVYGVTSFTVQRRTREFGVRLALGAKPSDILVLVFRQGARQLLLALILGSAAGLAVGRPLAARVEQMLGPTSPAAHAVVFGVVGGAVALALWIPARRAAKVDPMLALRAD